jgi:hypothetical protein
VVFKRRAANSTALRKHFSSGGLHKQASTAASKAAGESSGPLKPQHIFKKQKKKPLLLWSGGSTVQQMPMGQRHTPQQPTPEPEPSHNTTSSAAAACHGNVSCSGSATCVAGSTAETALLPAAAAAAVSSSGVESVLTALVHQQQQLLELQQQLRQRRQEIIARRQQQQRPCLQQLAEPVAVAANPADVEMTEAVNPDALWAVPAVPAVAPFQASEQPQPVASSEALPEAITALMAIANALAVQQQTSPPAGPAARGEAGNASSPWGDEIVHKLTAALLAA